jgi:Fe2+ or Zn2+ uptake regulation protein
MIDTVSQQAELFAQTMLAMLQANSLRMTAPRRAIVSALACGPSHSTAQQVLKSARADHPALGRASVYRTLEILSRLGAVRPWASPRGEIEFVRVLGGHHHLICSSCGELEEIPYCQDTCPAGKLAGGAHVHGHLVELVGVCSACLRMEEA